MPRAPRTPKPGDPQVVDVLAAGWTAPSADQPAPAPAPARPVPEAQLTPDQRRIRELEDHLAKERGRKDSEPEAEPVADAAADGNLVVHFCEDGITALGKVWYRGEQRVFDQRAYRDTCDRHGRSWLDLVDDEQGQIGRWGKVMFRRGPWPGKRLLDAAAGYEPLKPLSGSSVAPTLAELEAADRAETAARATAPRLPLR